MKLIGGSKTLRLPPPRPVIIPRLGLQLLGVRSELETDKKELSW